MTFAGNNGAAGASLNSGRVSRSTAASRNRSSTTGSDSDRPSICSTSGPKTMCARLIARYSTSPISGSGSGRAMFASTSACISLRTSSNASVKSATPAGPPSRVTRLMYPAMNGLSAMSWSNACRRARAATGGG